MKTGLKILILIAVIFGAVIYSIVELRNKSRNKTDNIETRYDDVIIPEISGWVECKDEEIEHISEFEQNMLMEVTTMAYYIPENNYNDTNNEHLISSRVYFYIGEEFKYQKAGYAALLNVYKGAKLGFVKISESFKGLTPNQVIQSDLRFDYSKGIIIDDFDTRKKAKTVVTLNYIDFGEVYFKVLNFLNFISINDRIYAFHLQWFLDDGLDYEMLKNENYKILNAFLNSNKSRFFI